MGPDGVIEVVGPVGPNGKIMTDTVDKLVTTIAPIEITTESPVTMIPCGFGFRRDAEGICRDIDECAEGSPCEHFCVNAEGTYQCNCKIGYNLKDNGRCEDFNECKHLDNICGNQQCLNLDGSFKCVKPCRRGYQRTLNNKCEDIDECFENTHNCDAGHICLNKRGGFRCVCPRGYRMILPQRQCVDINECSIFGVRVCQHTCTNTIGSFACSCRPGYTLDYDGKRCNFQVVALEKPKEESTETQIQRPRPKCYIFQDNEMCVCKKPYVYDVISSTCKTLHELFPSTFPLIIAKDLASRKFRTQPPPLTLRTTLPPTTKAPTKPPTQPPTKPPTQPPTQPPVKVVVQKPQNNITAVIKETIKSCPRWYSRLCDWRCESNDNGNACTCPAGYNRYYIGKCVDEDECLLKKLKCPKHSHCFNTKGGAKCVDYKCPSDYEEVRHGLCEKSCRINARFGYCRRNYIQYHTISLTKDTFVNKELITLRANTELIGNMGRAQFYIEQGTSNYKIKAYHDRAVMRTGRYLRYPGHETVVIVADIFDKKERLVCRTKFFVYVDISNYVF